MKGLFKSITREECLPVANPDRITTHPPAAVKQCQIQAAK